MKTKEDLTTTSHNNEMFGNTQFISLTNPDGSNDSLDGRPIHYEGVHGLLYHRKHIHLLSEDDGHFWTHWVVTENELISLKELIELVQKNITLRPNWKFNIKNIHQLNYSKDNFTCEISLRSATRPLLTISKKDDNNPLMFDCSFMPEILNLLNYKEQK